jgi:hypothetical protein
VFNISKLDVDFKYHFGIILETMNIILDIFNILDINMIMRIYEMFSMILFGYIDIFKNIKY